MKRLLVVIKFYLKVMSKDRLFFTAMLIFPILFGTIFSLAGQAEKKNVITCEFVDYDSTDLSSELYKRLGNHKEIHITTHADDYKKLLENNKVESVIIVHKGFEQDIKAGKINASIDILTSPSSFSQEFLSETISSDISVINSKYLSRLLISDKYKNLGMSQNNLNEQVDNYYTYLTDTNPLLKVNYTISNSASNVEVNSAPSPQSNIGFGGLLMFLMFFLIFGSNWIIEEKSNGTLSRVMTIKNGFDFIFWGAFLTLIIIGIIQAILFISFGFIINSPIIQNIYGILIIFIFVICLSSISMFLSSFFKTPMQLQSFTPFFTLLTSFAGGCFLDISLVSKNFKTLSLLTPQGLALSAFRYCTNTPYDLTWITYIIILLTASSTLLCLSYKTSLKA